MKDENEEQSLRKGGYQGRNSRVTYAARDLGDCMLLCSRQASTVVQLRTSQRAGPVSDPDSRALGAAAVAGEPLLHTLPLRMVPLLAKPPGSGISHRLTDASVTVLTGTLHAGSTQPVPLPWYCRGIVQHSIAVAREFLRYYRSLPLSENPSKLNNAHPDDVSTEQQAAAFPM